MQAKLLFKRLCKIYMLLHKINEAKKKERNKREKNTITSIYYAKYREGNNLKKC